jgi:hypothetical protein
MASLRRQGRIETSEDMGLERREWRVQRVAWGLLAVFVLAGAAGVFGDGPVARATVARPGFELSYDRFTRHHSPDALELAVTPGAGGVAVWLDEAFLARVEMEPPQPEPDEIEVLRGRVLYRWKAEPSVTAAHLRFNFKHRRVGRARGQIGVESGPSLAFTQLVYP